MTAETRPRPIRVWKPTVSVARCADDASTVSRRACSHTSTIRRARGSSASPAAVSATVRWPRSNSDTRGQVSSRRICLLSAGCETNGRSLAARVVVHYASDDTAATDTVAAIERAGGRAFAVRAELGPDGDVDTLFAGLEHGLAERPLDILVNNAAEFAGPLDQVTPQEFDRLLAVNVKAPYFIVKRALPLPLPLPLPRDGGRIVNISSAATRIALPETAYAMSKGALDVLGRDLANQLGPRGITVNTLAPGVTETDMNTGYGTLRTWSGGAPRSPRWAGSANPRTWPTPSRSSSPTTPAGSPATGSAPRAVRTWDAKGSGPRLGHGSSSPIPTASTA